MVLYRAHGALLCRFISGRALVCQISTSAAAFLWAFAVIASVCRFFSFCHISPLVWAIWGNNVSRAYSLLPLNKPCIITLTRIMLVSMSVCVATTSLPLWRLWESRRWSGEPRRARDSPPWPRSRWQERHRHSLQDPSLWYVCYGLDFYSFLYYVRSSLEVHGHNVVLDRIPDAHHASFRSVLCLVPQS